MNYAISLIAAAYATVTLASFVAVRNVSGVLDGMGRQGGGIGDYSAGVAAAAQWPAVAAWVAVFASVVAMLLVERRARLQPGAPAPAGRRAEATPYLAVAIAAGVGSVIAFRATIAFISSAVLPGGVPTPVSAVPGRLLVASAITALCVLAAIAVLVGAFRSRAATRFAMVALVVSLGVSASLVVTLRSMTAKYHAIATGDVRGIDHLR